MTAVVVDTSVAVKWLLDEPGSESAGRLMTENQALLAPDLLLVETANVLWKKIRRGEMPAADLDETLSDLLSLDINFYGSGLLLGRASRLALQLGHPVYDCMYLALAAETGAPIATADRRLRRAADGIGIGLWGGL